MKQMFIAMVCLCSIGLIQAQDMAVDRVQIGDQLILGEPSAAHYKHVDVPRKNFIIKRGGIANMSTLINESVTVTDITYGKTTQVTFRRTNGKKFFRVYNSFTTDLDRAVESGEIKIPD
ncbi:hypothetical protein [Flagellimonas myxillae]|uniref:hypothetical protein n=1 Tax=Flagellimonas myxillae TaxID=2942214 RepID=UPI00201F2D67|nr:hypothetical protein [Muricauda myxillae]MCL6267532.1 hypothetical protein [Muricauda myxillae]